MKTARPTRNDAAEAARLYLANEALACWCFRRFFSRPGGKILMRRAGGYDAAIQECRIALWESCRRYNPGSGCTLSTYASRCVWGALTTLCQGGAGGGPIRVPNHGGHHYRPETVEARARAGTCVSFDADLHDPPAPDGDQTRENRVAVDTLLSGLAVADAAALRLRYVEGMGLAEMARLFGRTKEAARQRVARALRHARAVAAGTGED